MTQDVLLGNFRLKMMAASASLVGTICVGLAYIGRGVPRYFWGDDLLLLESSRTTGGYINSFGGSLVNTGSGKWRPLFQVTAYFMTHWFEGNYLGYFAVNLMLLACIGTVAGWIMYQVSGRSLWCSLIVSFTVTLSPNFFYSRVSPFGVMELGACLLALLFVYVMVTVEYREPIRANVLAIFTALGAGFMHERYLILLLVGALIALSAEGTIKQRFNGMALWLGVLLSYFGLRSLVASTSGMFNGGGETSLLASKGFWIVPRFFNSFGFAIGGSNGTIKGFTSTDPGAAVSFSPLLILITLIVGGLITYLVGRCIYEWFVSCLSLPVQVQPKGSFGKTKKLKVLGLSALSCLVPASTVVSRIEPRWLSFSQILICVLFIGLLNISFQKFNQFVGVIFLVGVLIFNIACLSNLDEYEYPMRITNSMMDQIQLTAPANEPYTVIIVSDDEPGQTPWRGGYGMVFNLLKHPPFQDYAANSTYPQVELRLRNKEWNAVLIEVG